MLAGTETEDERGIVIMCCKCNERVPIQMKENGSCHGKYFFCKKDEEHLVCSAVNPDIIRMTSRIHGVIDAIDMYH